MKRISAEELLEMGQQYQQKKEATSVNLDAYMVNGRPYYLAIYRNKRFSMGDKGCAILSNEGGNEADALRSLKPHVYYGVTNNTMINIGKQRASLKITPLLTVKEYVKTIIDAGVLEQGDQKIYERTYDTLHGMEMLQEELVNLSEKADRLYERVQKRGYFTDEDVEKSTQFIPALNLIQYKQLKDRYAYRTDFDLVYQKRNDADIKRVAPKPDVRLLKDMTSRSAGPDMKETLDAMEEGENFADKSDDQLIDIFSDRLDKGLVEYAERSRATMRHPVVGSGEVNTPAGNGPKNKPAPNTFFWFMMFVLVVILIMFVVN